MGSTAHNCGVNAILASLFGKRTSSNFHPYKANKRITWIFRLFLAEQLPKHGTVGGLSVEDWRRSLTMMYEGPLFRPEEFEGGKRGEGLNISIEEFKKMREIRLKEWLADGKRVSVSQKMKLEENLKHHYQWEDFKHHHWALIAKVLDVEINIRTSKSQTQWIIIKPDELCPEISIPTIPIKHNNRIWLRIFKKL